MKTSISCLLAFAVAVTLPAGARAQTADEAQAFDLYKESKGLMEAGKFDEAVRLLDRAYALFPMPQIQLRQAEANEKAGNLETALELYRKIEDAKLKPKAQKAAADLKALLDLPVEITIQTNPPGADLTVDHLEQYRTPTKIRLTRGAHHLSIKKPGFRPLDEDRRVTGAATQTWTLDLRPVTGQVILSTDLDRLDGLVVRLDDRELTPRPGRVAANRSDPLPIAAGPHRILCVREGLAPFTGEFEVPPDGTIEVTCRLRPPERKPNAWKWTAVAVGSAAALAGAGLTGWYFYQKGPGGKVVQGTDYREGWIGVGLLVAGAATAITTGILLPNTVASEPAGQGVPVSIGVLPLPGGGQASVSLAF